MLALLPPLPAPSLEIGNGRYRRGPDLGATYTLDLAPRRRPSVVGDGHALPFRSGSLSAIAICETLQYVNRPDLVLSQCWMALRRGGRLLVSVPFTRRQDLVTDRWRWTEAGVRALVEGAGFVVWRVFPLVRWWGAPSGFVVEARA